MHTSLPKVGFCNKIWLQSMHTFFILCLIFRFCHLANYLFPPSYFVIVIVIVFVITHPPSFPSFIPFFSSAFHVSHFTNPYYILLIYLYLQKNLILNLHSIRYFSYICTLKDIGSSWVGESQKHNKALLLFRVYWSVVTKDITQKEIVSKMRGEEPCPKNNRMLTDLWVSYWA